MKNYLLILFASFTLVSNAQEQYSRVKIFGTAEELRTLGDLGLPLDHGEYKNNTFFISDFSASDIALMEANGFTYEIIIEDVKAHYVQQNLNPPTRNNRSACGITQGYDPQTPANFQLGTMGGYYKYQEFLDELDSMKSKYPNLISAKAPIDSYVTIDGNPIYWLRISDNPETDEAEEEVLYTSIHHAREPGSLSQTIYYMWYILENYGTSEEITFLVDNTEMYFVPMINPDGYKYNELTDPNGGGMHRKNRRNVGSTNKGVDLNRNYGYHWNQSGTSPNTNSDTYAGTGAFSEVETQAMRWFCENREFKFAFNAHTHGNLLLYPIGWSSVEEAPHKDYFETFTTHMVKHNGYSNIKSSGLYPAAGDSDDWMYIDDIGVNGRDTIYAMTPEVSDAGFGSNQDFWPPSNMIEDICKANVHMNTTLAHMPHIFGITEDLEISKITETSGYFSYELERLGLTDGDIIISMTAVEGIQTLGGANTHTLALMETVEDSISFMLNGGMSFGDPITYVIETNNGTWTRRDTVYKTYGIGTEVFNDPGSNTSNWTGDWSFTNEDFVSPSTCITDSPFNDHSNQDESTCQLIPTFTLDGGTYAYVNFWAKWEIEENYDYVEFMISTDGGSNWIPLCGKYTNPGTSNQDLDEPLYDGDQLEWVFEEIDLSDYLGSSNVSFKFRLVSDMFEVRDGFYFDDFQILTDTDQSTTIGIKDNQLSTNDFNLFPNPTNDVLKISIAGDINVNKIQVTNDLGQVIKEIQPNGNFVSLETNDLSEGVYFVNMINDQQEIATKRFVILR